MTRMPPGPGRSARLVEDEEVGVVEQAARRRRAAASCPGSTPVPGHPPGGAARRPRAPRRRGAAGRRSPAPARPGWAAGESRGRAPAPRPARRPARGPGQRAAQGPDRTPSSSRKPARIRPSSIRMVVVLPAPLGPRKPRHAADGDVEVEPTDGHRPLTAAVAVRLAQATGGDGQVRGHVAGSFERSRLQADCTSRAPERVHGTCSAPRRGEKPIRQTGVSCVRVAAELFDQAPAEAADSTRSSPAASSSSTGPRRWCSPGSTLGCHEVEHPLHPPAEPGRRHDVVRHQQPATGSQHASQLARMASSSTTQHMAKVEITVSKDRSGRSR